jgi:hypothetical protein
MSGRDRKAGQGVNDFVDRCGANAAADATVCLRHLFHAHAEPVLQLIHGREPPCSDAQSQSSLKTWSETTSCKPSWSVASASAFPF